MTCKCIQAQYIDVNGNWTFPIHWYLSDFVELGTSSKKAFLKITNEAVSDEAKSRNFLVCRVQTASCSWFAVQRHWHRIPHSPEHKSNFQREATSVKHLISISVSDKTRCCVTKSNYFNKDGFFTFSAKEIKIKFKFPYYHFLFIHSFSFLFLSFIL